MDCLGLPSLEVQATWLERRSSLSYSRMLTTLAIPMRCGRLAVSFKSEDGNTAKPSRDSHSSSRPPDSKPILM